jgi:hypothetical protein
MVAAKKVPAMAAKAATEATAAVEKAPGKTVAAVVVGTAVGVRPEGPVVEEMVVPKAAVMGDHREAVMEDRRAAAPRGIVRRHR